MCQPAGPEAPACSMYEYVRVGASPSRVLSCVARKPGCKSASLASVHVHGDVMSLPGRPDNSERLPAAESQHPVQSNPMVDSLNQGRYCTLLATLTCQPEQSRKLLDARTNELRRLRSYKSNGPKQRCIRSAERLRKAEPEAWLQLHQRASQKSSICSAGRASGRNRSFTRSAVR